MKAGWLVKEMDGLGPITNETILHALEIMSTRGEEQLLTLIKDEGVTKHVTTST